MSGMWLKIVSIHTQHSQYCFTQCATVDLASALYGFMKVTSN